MARQNRSVKRNEFFLSKKHTRHLITLSQFRKLSEVGECRGVFRTQLNIYDEAFLQKQLTTKSRQVFSQKSSIVDVRLSSKYTFGMNKKLRISNFFHTFNYWLWGPQGSQLILYYARPENHCKFEINFFEGVLLVPKIQSGSSPGASFQMTSHVTYFLKDCYPQHNFNPYCLEFLSK